MATATAMEDSYVCHLSRDKFMEVMYGDNNLSMELIKLLSNDLKNSEKKLISISQKSVLERISEALVLLHDKFGLD
jgi:CRP/FNR family transcriptional regulator, polysaccharide utilization system transcription regulator